MARTIRTATGVALLAAAALLMAAAMLAQAPKQSSFVGTVSAVRLEFAEIEARRDDGLMTVVRLSDATALQSVAAGEKDLRKAGTSTLDKVRPGDRILATFTPDSPDARRIVIMPAGEIAKRNDADREDWQKRGVAGVVASRNGNQITLKIRSFSGEKEAVVVAGSQTAFRRYAPDSVRFADAAPGKLSEVTAGDQLRARGVKSEDGLIVEAEEIVFGTFVTKAGSITAVDADARQVTVREMGTGRVLIVNLTPDSQLKAMPSFGGAPGGGPGAMPAGMPPGGPGMGPGGPPAGPNGGPSDIAQRIERMPAARIEDLKPGTTIVVSSTRGAHNGELTAIVLLANADFLIKIATAQSGRSSGAQSAPDMGGAAVGIGGMTDGLGGLELPGLMR
jgi:hypothetical protein